MQEVVKHIAKIFLLVSVLFWVTGVYGALGTDSRPQFRADSAYHHMRSESGSVRGKMMDSPFPVELRQQGRQIFAQTDMPQLLPVYTGAGTYYAAFRLNKGNNWITGLPKGTYYINGRKFRIS